MKHAREDYNRIQDPENKIPKDEPVCLFRGQDVFITKVLAYYISLVAESGGDQKIIESLSNHIKEIIKWQGSNFAKLPDMPKNDRGTDE